MSTHPACIHLRTHSDFSIVDGLASPKKLVEAAVRKKMPALALTDRWLLSGWIKFYTAALLQGIKPLLGLDCFLASFDRTLSDRKFPCTLLAMNNKGYGQLIQLSSQAYLKNPQQAPNLLTKELLGQHSSDLICLSGGPEGWLGHALLHGSDAVVRSIIDFYTQYFADRFYIELQRVGAPEEAAYIERALHCAKAYNLPIVATNPVYFLEAQDFEAHAVRVAIHEGRCVQASTNAAPYTTENYFCSAEALASKFADLPEALANTLLIAQRCTLTQRLNCPVLPQFPCGTESPEGYLRRVALLGLKKRLLHQFPDPIERERQETSYFERLEHELAVIHSMGFSGYFLIVMEFIQWAKAEQIPVGPGRGSGAGSLVAYALTISDLDPLRFGLLFERFLNPNRISLPDFDIDFCMEKRDLVIAHVKDLYGAARVAQIITFGTLAAKAAVRDVGRALGLGYGFVDRIAKCIPFELGITIGEALERETALQKAYETDDEARQLIDMARRLEGVTRQVGKHAGGVVIAPTALTDFTPLYQDEEGGMQTTQFDMKDVEQVGLVKFDFLGLKTLTVIDWAVQLINQERSRKGESPLDIREIPLDDPCAFSYLQQAETVALFQLESPGMRDLVRRSKPSSFEDLIALVSLFRPGPLQSGMISNFIERKNGREPIAYPDPEYQHELLKPILEPTYGIILYQEQVMQIAQVLAGYSLGEADLLRRAMGKKQPEEMAKQRERFGQGAERQGISSQLAMHIFDLVEKFAGYGFNKSHSAGYALLVYQTLWLKTHYPQAYMAAAMSADMGNTDRLADLIADCRHHGWPLDPPSIHTSEYKFAVSSDGKISYGLGAIKGVGRHAAEHLVEVRKAHGAFSTLGQFLSALDYKKISRRVLERLICAGALDSFSWRRAYLVEQLPCFIKAAQQWQQSKRAQQGDLFATQMGNLELPEPASNLHDWSLRSRLKHEYEAFGFYWSQHPSLLYTKELHQYKAVSLGMLQTPFTGTRVVTTGGWIESIKVMTTKQGKRFRLITLVEGNYRVEVVLFDEESHHLPSALQEEEVIVLRGEARWNNFGSVARIRPQQIQTLVELRSESLQGLAIEMTHALTSLSQLETFRKIITPYANGSVPLYCFYGMEGVYLQCTLDKAWQVVPQEALLVALRDFCGEESIQLWFNDQHTDQGA